MSRGPKWTVLRGRHTKKPTAIERDIQDKLITTETKNQKQT